MALELQLDSEHSLDEIAGALEDYLRSQKHLKTERIGQSVDSCSIQVREAAEWRKFVGASRSFRFRLAVCRNALTIEPDREWRAKESIKAVFLPAPVYYFYNSFALWSDILLFLRRYTIPPKDAPDSSHCIAYAEKSANPAAEKKSPS